MRDDKYGEPETMVFPNSIVKIYRPILTDAERKKRRKAIHDAAANLLRQAEGISR